MIYKQIFVIFLLLVVKNGCRHISKNDYEKTELEPAVENDAQDSNSTYLEYEVPELEPAVENDAQDSNSTYLEYEVPDGNHQAVRTENQKRSLEPEPNIEETVKSTADSTADARDFSESKYFTNTNSESELLADENHLYEEEESSEKSFTASTKYQSRGLKYYIDKENEGKDIHLGENQVIGGLNSKHGRTKSDLNSNKLLEKDEETLAFLTKKRIDQDLLNDVDPNLSDLSKMNKYLHFLSEMGLDYIVASTPVNPEIMERILKISDKLLSLVEKDIKSNVIPLVFYQIWVPVMKEKFLFPLLKLPATKEVIAKADGTYKVPGLCNIMRNLITKLPEGAKENDDSMSNISKFIDKYFNESFIENNEINRKLARWYRKNLKDTLKIIDKGSKENETPINIYKFLAASFEEDLYLIIRDIIFKILTEKLKRNYDRNKNDFQLYLESLESSEDMDDLSEDTFNGDVDEDPYEDGLNFEHLSEIIRVEL